MNDEQQGNPPGGDKLDQWIEQNLHKDLPKANPAPAQEPKKEIKPEHNSKTAGQNAGQTGTHTTGSSTQGTAAGQPASQQGAKPAHPGQQQGAKHPAHSGHQQGAKPAYKAAPHHKPAGAQATGANAPYGKPQGRRPYYKDQGRPQGKKTPYKSNYKPGFKPASSAASFESKTTPPGSHHAASPHKTGSSAQQPIQPKKKFLGIFGGRNSAGKGQSHATAPAASAFAKTPSTSPAFAPRQEAYRGKLRLIMVGGLDEVGKNCMILEYGNDIILIDMGFQFPEEDMLGVDYVIPDLSYLDDKIDRIRAIVITHGHLDHVGAIPYVMAKLNFPPIYATKLTNGLIQKRLEEFGLLQQTKLIDVTKDDIVQLGQFNVSFFHVNHSIPDAVGIVVKTPAGNIVHTGDFKFDFTPSGDQAPPDFARIASLGTQNIAALFIDSTNALRPGYTISEKKVGASLENVIKNTDGRILIASFSSQIGRIQQIIDYAKRHGRTIFLSGRSLIDNVYIASKLGYLKVPQGIAQDIRKMGKIPENKVIILTTGSQGESLSALSRMALEDHPKVKIKKGDVVVLSSSPIPGNEKAISLVTNNLCKLGARIINNQIMDVHTSGHAQQEDLKLMMNLVKAKNIVPVHGEYYMRFGNKEIAMAMGYNEKNVALVENGAVLEIENGELKVANETVENKYILIDGLGVGDIGAQVIMDRQTLAENGVLILVINVDEKTQKIKKDIDVISRGFIYMKESEELVKAISEIARDAYTRVVDKRGGEAKRGDVKKYIKETVDKFVHQKIERHPLVLPVIIEQ